MIIILIWGFIIYISLRLFISGLSDLIDLTKN